MSKLWNWLRKLHFHKWKVIQELDWFYEREHTHYFDPITEIEECQICGLKKKSIYLGYDIETCYLDPSKESNA